MKKVPSDIKKFLVVCGLVALIGGGEFYWAHQKLTNERIELYSMTQKIELLQRQGAQDDNLAQLERNEINTARILQRLEPILTTSSEPLNVVQNLNADGWKKLLSEKASELAKKSTDIFPKDFCYGFSNFKENMPESGDVFHLGIQLLAAEELCKILTESRLANLKAIRRAAAEKNVSDKSDFVDEKIENKEFYFSYPFEMEFSCKPEGLRRFLNGILASKFLFIPQSIEVLNEHDPRQTFKNILKDKKEKTFFVVSGEEDILVKMRVNLLLWKL